MKRTFYIVASDALPDVFEKVIRAKELIESGDAKNISAAIKMCDLSRSAFYKYKDSVFKAKETEPDKVELQAVLMDRAGAMSALSNTLFRYGANIITINQSAPQNGLASVSVVIATDGMESDVEELINNVESLPGVMSIKQV